MKLPKGAMIPDHEVDFGDVDVSYDDGVIVTDYEEFEDEKLLVTYKKEKDGSVKLRGSDGKEITTFAPDTDPNKVAKRIKKEVGSALKSYKGK